MRPRSPSWITLVWVLVFTLMSCGREGGNECSSDIPCGFGATCVNGYCEGATCNTSAECPMEHVCDDKRRCTPGCQRDGDCYPGDACDLDSGTCKADRCENTHLDCGFREYCNVGSGECYDAGERFCRPCTEDVECGTGYCYAGACTVDCSDGQECPSGFTCSPFGDGAGNILSYQCWTFCWLYDDYKPGSF